MVSPSIISVVGFSWSRFKSGCHPCRFWWKNFTLNAQFWQQLLQTSLFPCSSSCVPFLHLLSLWKTLLLEVSWCQAEVKACHLAQIRTYTLAHITLMRSPFPLHHNIATYTRLLHHNNAVSLFPCSFSGFVTFLIYWMWRRWGTISRHPLQPVLKTYDCVTLGSAGQTPYRLHLLVSALPSLNTFTLDLLNCEKAERLSWYPVPGKNLFLIGTDESMISSGD